MTSKWWNGLREWVVWAVLASVLSASFVFMLVTWNTGKVIKEVKAIACRTVEKQSENLRLGEKRYVTRGSAGFRVVYYEDRGGKKGPVLLQETVKAPRDRVVMVAKQPPAAVAEGAGETMNAYLGAWKSGDFTSMWKLVNPDEPLGATSESVADAYQASGEKLTGFKVGEVAIYDRGYWQQKQEQADPYFRVWQRQIMAYPRSIEKATMVAEAYIDLSLSCPFYEDTTVKGTACLLYSDGSWKVQHIGALRRFHLGYKEVDTETYDNGEVVVQATLDSIILYTDHFSVVTEDMNASTGDLSGTDQETIPAYNWGVTLMSGGSSRRTELLVDLSTPVKNVVIKRGDFQDGIASHSPAAVSGDTIGFEDFYCGEFPPFEVP